ncbi:hypothetical protein KEM55_003157, partial [Ascosphaera atra]
MFRQLAVRSYTKAPVSNRAFSTAAVRMGEGDTGHVRNTGTTRSGDAWTNREAAEENVWVKRKEMEKLDELKAKLQKQREHLDELEKH